MSPTTKHRSRKGGTYVIVLGTAIMVTTLGLVTISSRLIQSQQSVASANALQAAANSDAAIRVGLQLIQSNENWREYGHGTWQSGPMASGNYILSGYDFSDGILNNDDSQAVTLVATGIQRDARHHKSLTLVPVKQPLDSLRFVICAGKDISFTDSKLTFSGTIAANGRVEESGDSSIDVDVEANDTIIGDDYLKTTTSQVGSKLLPSVADVMAEYEATATVIDIDDLPTSTPNLFRDPDMEDGHGLWTNSWETGHECEVRRSTETAHAGSRSLEVTDRNYASDGPAYYLTHVLESDRSYDVSCWVKMSWGTRVRFALNTNSGSGDEWVRSGWQTVGTSWTNVAATIDAPQWDGLLDRAMLKIETDPTYGRPSFYMDAVAIVGTGSTASITHACLSDQENPFGSVDPNGRYVIDCDSNDLRIEHTRLRGTLIIKNAGRVTIGPGPVHWEPLRLNIPTLLCDGQIELRFGVRALSEYLNNVNYNGATPFSIIGIDSDRDAVYPSRIHGLIMTERSVNLTGSLHLFDAAIVATDDVVLTDAAVDMTGNSLLQASPPPSMTRTELRLLRGGAAPRAD
ncbi:MAG: carbohydrate binding domain-containing protein [Planctomycetales bacterium]|nr:carbohydrate binding domain-containing protein [Planctomycetales bacterium]